MVISLVGLRNSGRERSAAAGTGPIGAVYAPDCLSLSPSDSDSIVQLEIFRKLPP
jgi:hypothetical protein